MTSERCRSVHSYVRASSKRFMKRFERAEHSVPQPSVAGLTLPQNNGLVEGKVNKLKLIKRMVSSSCSERIEEAIT